MGSRGFLPRTYIQPTPIDSMATSSEPLREEDSNAAEKYQLLAGRIENEIRR
jgi:hypothetical protein